MKIIGIDHLVLRTRKLPQMLRFYESILGCSVERQLSPELGLTQLRAGNTLIDLVTVDSELGRLGGKPPQQDGRNLEHFCLRVTDVNQSQLLAHLHHHHIETDAFEERYGATGFGHSVYIKDPEGNVVELKLD